MIEKPSAIEIARENVEIWAGSMPEEARTDFKMAVCELVSVLLADAQEQRRLLQSRAFRSETLRATRHKEES